MRAVLIRSLAVIGVGLVILVGILYYASTVDSRPPLVDRIGLTQHQSGDDHLALTTTSIEVEFSEPVRADTAEAAFDILPTVDGTFTWAGTTLTFTPTDRLPLETDFEVSIGDGVLDEAGNRIADLPEPFTFETVGPPMVAATEPADGASDVPLDAPIVVEFSSLMDTASVEEALQVEPPLAVEASWSAEQLTLTPVRQLEAGTNYTITIGIEARDSAGVALRRPYRFSFRSAASSLEVTALAPADGSEGVAITGPIAVFLDRELEPDSVTADLLSIEPEVAGTVSVVPAPGAAGLSDPRPRLVRFEASAPLAANTTYRVTLLPGLLGTDGAQLGEPIEWSFTTGTPLSTLSNQVVFISARAGVPNLWAMNPDGSVQRQITAELSPVTDYAVAPDGRSLVIGDGAVLVRQQADGSDRTLLTEGDVLEFDPAWAPDGSRFAFGRAELESGTGLGIWTRAADGGDAQRLELPEELLPGSAPSPPPSGPEAGSLLRAPRYSPDGAALAYVDLAGRVGVVELPAQRLTTAPLQALGTPVWLRDSTAILVSTLPDARLQPPTAGQPLPPMEVAWQELTTPQLNSLQIAQLDRGASRARTLDLPPGATRPSISGEQLLFVQLQLQPGDTAMAGVLWLSPELDAPSPGRRLLDDGGPLVVSAAFGVEPRTVVAARAGGGVWLVDALTGEGEELSADGRQPRWLP